LDERHMEFYVELEDRYPDAEAKVRGRVA